MAYRVLAMAGEDSLASVLAADCDGAVIDLADTAVQLEEIRTWFGEALQSLRKAGRSVIARVNHPRTGLLRGDLEVVVQDGLDAVILPHATAPQDIRRLAVLLRELELPREMEPGTVRVFPALDNPRGLLRALDLCTAAPRVAGLLFDPAGYAMSVGARFEEAGPRLAFARGLCVAAARAADGVPLVVGDGSGSRRLAQYGFGGIVLSDLNYARAARAAFTLGSADLDRARAVVTAYEATRAAGGLAARVGRHVADSSDARRARQRLEGTSTETD